MAAKYPQVPMLEMTAEESRTHLVLVLERVVYLLHWIADNPDFLIDGRHHQNLRDAVQSLEKRIAPGGWENMIPKVSTNERRKLDSHGLTGAEFSLKVHAFDQPFQKVLDSQPWLEREVRGLRARIETLEIREATARMRRVRKSTRTALEAGQSIVGSAIDAIPGIKEVGCAVKELTEICGGLIKH